MADQDNFSKYDKQFQLKILSLITTNYKNFLTDYIDCIKVDYFEIESLRWIVNKIKVYYDNYKCAPPLLYFKEQIKDEVRKDFQTILAKDVLNMYKLIENGHSELEWVFDESSTFLKNQAVKDAIINSVDMLGKGDFEGIKAIINESMNIGNGDDLGMDYFEEINDRYEQNHRDPVRTPWGVINEITNGGLGRGELGILVAGPATGKTWALCRLGSEALRMGLNVVHYTLELSKYVTGYRYDSIFTELDNSKLFYVKTEVIDTITKLKKKDNLGKLIIKQYPTKGASVTNILANIKKIQLMKWNPDMIIIDYGDLLLPSRVIKGQDNSYHTSGGIYEEIRGLASELNMAVWSASQVERNGTKEDVIEGTHIAESFKKIHIADLAISISRKKEDIPTKTARYHIIKNRNGVDKVTYEGILDPSIGKIEIFPTESTFTSKSKSSKEKNITNEMKDVYKDLFDK